MADSYRRIAPWYDFFTGRALESARSRIRRLCRELGASRILDVGCGTGVLARQLAEDGRTVWGLDRSAAMLAQAREQQYGLEDRLAFVHADRPLPIASGSLDAVVLFLVVHESPAGEDLLSDSLALAPHVIVADWRMPERNLDYRYLPLLHLVERMAGLSHYRCFRQYARKGWLRASLDRCGAKVVSENSCLGGMLSVIHCQRISGP